MGNIILIMLHCLCVTLLVETVAALLFKIRGADLLYVVLVNVLTNPIVVYISMFWGYRFFGVGRILIVAIPELCAFLVEGFIYYKCLNNRKVNGYLFSLVLNICSYGIGEIINFFW